MSSPAWEHPWWLLVGLVVLVTVLGTLIGVAMTCVFYGVKDY